ncbi:hypothetical protein AB0N29_01585 [Nocardioides sp. NPDC092400]|uniref:hypothetical protein n=1 Tax=Nocardioides sp. NPDC092400 TaxID=3155196 RepID=UPI00342A529A
MSPRRTVLLLVAALLVLASGSARAVAASAPVLDLVVPAGREGQEVTATLTVTVDGAPGEGLAVTFRRTGPGSATGGPVEAVTDAVGTATYTYRLETAGDYSVEAEVVDAEGSSTGTGVSAYAEPSVVVCRCAAPGIRATNARNGDDRITVSLSRTGADAAVRLFRIRDGEAQRIRRTVLGEDGVVAWRVDDHNGRRATRYYAVAGATDVSPRARTKTISVL